MIRNCLITAALCVCAADAQPSARATWVPLDTSKPGTRADVKLDPAKSTMSLTAVDVVIHGFWLDPKQGPDGSYLRIVVPGLGGPDTIGAPDVPRARFDIAILTGARELKSAGATFQDTRTFTGINAWPRIYPELDHPGTPERFVKDDKIYASQTVYPTGDGAGMHALRSKIGPIRGITAEAYPVRWNPATKVLTVHRVAKFVFAHDGSAQEKPEITQDTGRLAARRFVNWKVVASGLNINVILYRGDFLFIYPTGYKDELQPLIDQKKARGFWTFEIAISSTGNTCASVRTLIQNWYNARPAWSDKYAILVGDTSVIPLCTAPTGSPTDDLYASTDGDDLDEEIYLGRLSVDSEADTANQVAKILRYEDHPSLFCCYDRALLVAHKQGAPGKYVGAHESVRTAAYAVPPVFSTLYGHLAGVDNTDVTAAINNGLGLVAYRGHGTNSEWWQWNTLGQSYWSADVALLTNLAAQVPVVWSFACDNNMLGTSDSIGETWMEDSDNRAVAHYGSTVPSGTDANHELDRQMFRAVYDLGLTTHSHAIKNAEAEMAAAEGSANAWMYLLLGDPQMQIRRRNPLNIKFVLPTYVTICKGAPCFLDISVLDEVGNPVPNALVAAYKGVKDGTEVFDNRYTDSRGHARIQASPASTGDIQVTFRDLSGNTAVGKVQVR